MTKINIELISKKAVDKIEEKSQAGNGWIAASSTSGTVKGRFSGIKVMAGDVLEATVIFTANSPCDMNNETLSLAEGDYIPTPGLILVTITSGKCLLIREEIIK